MKGDFAERVVCTVSPVEEFTHFLRSISVCYCAGKQNVAKTLKNHWAQDILCEFIIIDAFSVGIRQICSMQMWRGRARRIITSLNMPNALSFQDRLGLGWLVQEVVLLPQKLRNQWPLLNIHVEIAVAMLKSPIRRVGLCPYPFTNGWIM